MANSLTKAALLAALLTGLAAAAPRGKPNRLISEKSPYLLQHAFNPVDWHPWGEEAFAKAKREDKPIFLSIGYSTCHWCHVMERESFSDAGVAAVLNEGFIAVKVDREERPDIDEVYMTAAAAAGWGAGWPLSVWLTPQGEPFFGGTYFPKEGEGGRPGFAEVLKRVAQLWRQKRPLVERRAEDLAEALRRYAGAQDRRGPLKAEALEKAFADYEEGFTAFGAGFSRAPKFPMPANQAFLLRDYARLGRRKSLDMARRTLEEMARGGLYDQLGGGFHRYSTDEAWRRPHFEKMLYDNAQLALNYLEAYQVTGDTELARPARQTLDYVLREMTHPEGGFYSAQDADSARQAGGEKSEGAFYLWRKGEILEVLGARAGELFAYRYGVEEEGESVLYAAHTLQEAARRLGLDREEAERLLKEGRERLLQARARRPAPLLDDKILADWNGLMISALAKGARVFGEERYRQAARKAALFLRRRLYDEKSGRLYHRWRQGQRAVAGLALDYALLAQGLLDLYEADLDVEWLLWAERLCEAQLKLFYDEEKGGFYQANVDYDPRLPARSLEDSDKALPAASSTAALNLLRLAQFTGRKDFRLAAEKTLERFGAQLAQEPRSLPWMLVALDYALSKPRQIVIAGRRGEADTERLRREADRRFLPNTVFLLLEEGGRGRRTLLRWLPSLEGMGPVGGRAAAYVCVDYACRLPTGDPEVLGRVLDEGNLVQ